MVRSSLILVALLMAVPALAEEPVGCDKFKWPLDTERGLLAKASLAASGGEATLAAAVTLALVPFADAKLPEAPSRAPKFPDSYAGFLRISALPKAGTYRITLSHAAWIDVVQDGQELKPSAFSGAKGCDGIAKSVKFDLAATPFVIEVSGTSAGAIGLVVTPD
jgi:hypothetical protein